MAQLVLPEIFPITCHTNHVGPGSTFVAISGMKMEGMQFIAAALAKGATSIAVDDKAIISDELHELIEKHNARIIRTSNPRLFLAQESAKAAGYPAHSLKIVGITGTKGKTTTACLLFHMLKSAGYKAALLSTVKNSIDGFDFPAPLTTAQPDYLHQFLKVAVEYGVTHVVMEVAAQALSLHRVAGIEFDATVMTNFSLEHLEFFSSMEEYFNAKFSLFSQRKKYAPLFINGDNEWCRKVQIADSHLFGVHKEYAHRFEEVAEKKGGTEFILHLSGCSEKVEVPSLFGMYNRYNVVAASAVAHFLGVSFPVIKQALLSLPTIPGRLQIVSLSNGSCGIIDYAHNPDSFDHLLSTLAQRTAHLIVVFGAGGERDASRRPLMGNNAARYAQEIVLTSDNPRTEDPVSIIADIKKGIENPHCLVHEIIDRKQAIEYAYMRCRPGSILAVLGKGPDEYQIIGNQKTFFSDTQILVGLSKQSSSHQV